MSKEGDAVALASVIGEAADAVVLTLTRRRLRSSPIVVLMTT
eukprot:CAMPEP_0171552994 /NCGR_PEP_ID=MMETSP0960-20121227/8683_1 /TAXON_ID=87120 /ORGANISM="Aurantiochytrium limacinum, Strain ATCCMYA-1381" /LENGTH=41 /DNA_ID= /DNA_START= /DNA_END= /DNA_ORIENTATION=